MVDDGMDSLPKTVTIQVAKFFVYSLTVIEDVASFSSND